MRRRRKPLEVSTFPFLAVLLCAMGSLILVLLIMDRKAKMGARNKAIAAIAHAADEAEQMAAARRAELERHLQEKRAEKQAEWEKKRDALHTKLLTEQQALQLQMQQLREKITLAAARLRMEQEQSGEVKKKVASERAEIQGATQALVSTKQAVADTQTHTEQEKAALARMTNDLVVLERALQDLKETRERERQTYSVVPYNGKRGESRRPLYVECAGNNAIFHPDKKAVLVQLHPEEIRAEVAQRVVRQREQLAAAKMPVDQTPYLMLLVRPDGIFSYYAFEAALAGLDVQFGYELIDSDWLLDFPEENKPGTQAWQALAPQPQLPPLDPPAPSDAKVHGVQFHQAGPLMRAVASGPGGDALSGSRTPNSGRGGSGAPGDGRSGPDIGTDNPWSPGGLGRPVALGDGTGNNRGTGIGYGPGGTGPPKLPWETVGSGAPLPGQTPLRGYRGGNSDGRPPSLGSEETGSQVASSGLNGSSGGGTGDGTGVALSGSPTEIPAPGQGGNGPPGAPTSGSSPANSSLPRGNGGTGPGSATGPQVLAKGNATPEQQPSAGASPGNSAPTPGNANRDPGSNLPPLPTGVTEGAASGPSGSGANQGSGTPGSGTPGGGGTPGGSPSGGGGSPSGGPSGGSGTPGGTNQGGGQQGQPGDSAPGGAPTGTAMSLGDPGGTSEGQPQSILRPARLPGSEAKRPAPVMHAARLSGDRDYVIFLECRANSVVLYPAQREFPLASLIGGPNDPLVQALQQMIERKQSAVRPGDVPYRPQIRFLVRPQTLRAYHTVYPLLDGLPAAKTRQNLIPEDDVRAIIGGN